MPITTEGKRLQYVLCIKKCRTDYKLCIENICMRDATTIMKSASNCMKKEKLCERACFDDIYTERGATYLKTFLD
ncbi:hypothetical protein LSAT2_005914 [Lamellibrachia satsuma]|nr:hypothetical protein LSAT2_005914 [Lamellibrachia satsuma]